MLPLMAKQRRYHSGNGLGSVMPQAPEGHLGPQYLANGIGSGGPYALAAARASASASAPITSTCPHS